MDDRDVLPTHRRRFLKIMLSGIGAVLAGAAAWPLWRYLSPHEIEGETPTVTVDKSQVKPGEVHFIKFRGQPAVVLQPQPGTIVAFSAVCTHLGCIIQWKAEKGEFLCPCHGGRFGTDGKVLGGPPPSPLEQLKVTVKEDQILVG